ncbi:MAG: radical SAM protein [Gemmatimonadales bacterium]|nr:radical SAM protein [Gemmatimonadales bacterium]
MPPRTLDELRARTAAAVSYRLRTVLGGRFAARCRPTQLLILLTERCNARCVHCDIWKNRGQEDVAPADDWIRMLDDVRAWLGPVHVTFTGGEALLWKDAPRVVAHAARLGLVVEHLTHGYWKDQSRIEALARARPWRITISCDGVEDGHDRVRGREHFFDAMIGSLATLRRLRRDERLPYAIRLKTTIMAQNLDQLEAVARFAAAQEADVFYQPIEQNYNTPEDPAWFTHSPTWPGDPEAAVAAVQRLIALKREGLPIANSMRQLEVMVPYFRDPASMRVVTQAHMAHVAQPSCSALTMLQLQPNGDVLACASMPPVGNFRATPIRTIWEERPRWWEGGCCLPRRMAEAERTLVQLAGAGAR